MVNFPPKAFFGELNLIIIDATKSAVMSEMDQLLSLVFQVAIVCSLHCEGTKLVFHNCIHQNLIVYYA